MPEKKTIQRARKAARAGKAPSTQAGVSLPSKVKSKVSSSIRRAKRAVEQRRSARKAA